jgi:hypothetical protein
MHAAIPLQHTVRNGDVAVGLRLFTLPTRNGSSPKLRLVPRENGPAWRWLYRVEDVCLFAAGPTEADAAHATGKLRSAASPKRLVFGLYPA